MLGWNQPADQLPSNVSKSALSTIFNEFFIDKIIKIRDDIGYSSVNEVFNDVRYNISDDDVHSDCPPLESFENVSSDELSKIISASSSASCELDPIPTCLLKQCLPEILPFLTEIVNLSIKNATVSSSLKKAIVRPLLKKATLDPDILKNYRPISNLSFVSKLIERVVAARINVHLESHCLLETYQSAYRSFHSTESALLRVQNDILSCLDNKQAVALVMLDLSAAFDTIDHSILLRRLQTCFNITGDALSWIKSYLTGRYQCVSVDKLYSSDVLLTCGVPQGSVLGPLLFSLYMTPLSEIARRFNVMYHFYADDSQLYVSFNPKENVSLENLESCISTIKTWMQVNMLKLNDGKTEFILFATPYFSATLDRFPLHIGSVEINPSDKVRNLGAMFDSTLTMEAFVNDKIKSCIFYLSCIRRIRKFLTLDAAKNLVHAYVISRLDYANSLLSGANKGLIHKLQVVQNSAARLVCGADRFAHATPLLHTLHWLPIEQRIAFKVITLTFKCLHGLAPPYLDNLLEWYTPGRSLRSSDSFLLSCHRSNNSYGSRSFCNYAPVLWNALPLELRSSQSFVQFRRSLKTFLFTQYFECK